MKKPLIVIAAVLVLLLAAGGTVAWLTASATVTNAFTVGKIAISLEEDEWTNNSKIYPGAEIDKNPTVTVTAGSEDCFVYVLVDNQLNDAVTGAVSLDINTSDWESVKTSGNKTLYRYKDIVTTNSSDQELSSVFTTVTVSPTVVTEVNIVDLDGGKIEVKAYAHQSGATDQTTVDAEAIAHFGI